MPTLAATIPHRLQRELSERPTTPYLLGRQCLAGMLHRHGMQAQQPRPFVPQTTASTYGRRVALAVCSSSLPCRRQSGLSERHH